MSSGSTYFSRHGNLLRYKSVLVPALILLLAGVLLIGILRKPAERTLISRSPSVAKITTPAVLDVCEADFTARRSGERMQVRTAWPDGHTTAWVNLPGRVTAGVDLSEMEVNRSRDGLQVRLPRPEITGSYPDYDRVEWGYHNGFWTTNRDETALAFRQDLLTGAASTIRQQAEASGLLEEATTHVAVAVSRFASALGIDEIEITTGSGRVLPLGITNLAGGTERMEAIVGSGRNNGKLLIVIILAALTLFAGFRAFRRGGSQGIASASGTAVSEAVTEEVIFSNLRQLSSLNCGDYNGTVFVRDTVPLRLLGLRIADAHIWMSTPGTVRSAVDLSGLTRSGVRYTTIGDSLFLTITLPEPAITGTEVYPANGTQGRSPMLLIGGNATAVAQAEDRLMEEAQRQLEDQARSAGLLVQARSSAESTVRRTVRQLLGDQDIEVEIAFGSPASPGRPHQSARSSYVQAY